MTGPWSKRVAGLEKGGQSIMDTMSQRRFDSWGSTAFYAVACFHCALKQTSSTSSFLLQTIRSRRGIFYYPSSITTFASFSKWVYSHSVIDNFECNWTILQSKFLNRGLTPNLILVSKPHNVVGKYSWECILPILTNLKVPLQSKK